MPACKTLVDALVAGDSTIQVQRHARSANSVHALIAGCFGICLSTQRLQRWTCCRLVILSNKLKSGIAAHRTANWHSQVLKAHCCWSPSHKSQLSTSMTMMLQLPSAFCASITWTKSSSSTLNAIMQHYQVQECCSADEACLCALPYLM